MYPIVATGEARARHYWDTTAATENLPVATKGYRRLVHGCIVVVLMSHLYMNSIQNFIALHALSC
jgi:hypothetical protein